MDREAMLEKTKDYVKQTLGDDPAHDWFHTERVWKMAKRIAGEEGADTFVAELAALLHDVGDWKTHGKDEKAGPASVRTWMEKLGLDEKTTRRVCRIIEQLNYEWKDAEPDIKTKEGKVVFDADKLDAIGAVGIARVFAFGGHYGRKIHDPAVTPRDIKDMKDYKKSLDTGTSVSHFHEKLLHLKDKMYTKTGKKLAKERTEFMSKFLEKFFNEWEGKE